MDRLLNSPDQVHAADLHGLLEQAALLENERAADYLELARLAADMAEEPGVPLGERLRAQSELGNAYRINSHFTQALEALNGVIIAAVELPGRERSQMLALAHMRSAIVYDVLNSIRAGLEQLELANRYYTELGDEAGLAKSGLVRGALYSRAEDFDHAVECFLGSLAYYRAAGDNSSAASALSNLCVMYRILGRNDEAIMAGREAGELAANVLVRAAAQSNVAFALANAGRIEEAEAQLLEGGRLVEEMGDPNYIIEHQVVRASVAEAAGRLTEARDILEDALSAASAKGIRRNVIRAHSELVGLYRQLGDYRLALEHFEQYHELAMADAKDHSRQQLELHKWHTELEQTRIQAQQERDRRKQLAESLAELGVMHEQLSARATKLEWYSHRDALTELANRRYFDERLALEAERSELTGASVSLLMIDLDDFKSVNDRFGHLAGDEALRKTARLLESHTRRTDLCARMGGEEFAVLLTSDHDQAELLAVAEDLRSAFDNHDWTAVVPDLKVTISIGIASLDEVNHDPLSLLHLADSRLYAAKRSGRNRVISGQPTRRRKR